VEYGTLKFCVRLKMLSYINCTLWDRSANNCQNAVPEYSFSTIGVKTIEWSVTATQHNTYRKSSVNISTESGFYLKRIQQSIWSRHFYCCFICRRNSSIWCFSTFSNPSTAVVFSHFWLLTQIGHDSDIRKRCCR
jgi:hypothetical protein